LAPRLLPVLVTGGGMALMASINGRLARELGSAELAAVTSAAVSALALALSLVATGSAAAVAGGAWRARRDVRPAQLLAGCLMGIPITAGAYTVTRIGVALTTVAMLCGQMAAGLFIDGLGLSPGGRRALTPARFLGAGLAAVAVLVVAVHERHQLDAALFALAAGGGVAAAAAFTGFAQLAAVLGDVRAGVTVVYVLGTLTALVLWAVFAGARPPQAVPDWVVLGGILAAVIAVSTARLVTALGALRVGLGLVAGQSLVALALDVAWPPPGLAVTGWTLATVALVLGGAIISGRGPVPDSRTASGQPLAVTVD
jgi:transporter family-2 protein